MTTVAEMFGLLGIQTDFESVAKAQSALNSVKDAADRVTATEKLSAALRHQYGNGAAAVAKKMGFELSKVADAEERGAEKAGGWGRALLVLNQGLELGMRIYRGVQQGITAVVGAVEATADAATKAVELGQKVGLSAEAVQELGYAAQQDGPGMEALGQGLEKLAKNADLATHGGKQAARAFREAGVDVKDIKSGHEKLDGVLEQVADRFQHMPDGATKTALAMKLFGRAGAELVPLLNDGSVGIKQLREEAEKIGVVIDNDAAASLESFGDDADKLKSTLIGLRNQAIAALLPAIKSVVDGLQKWIQAHRGLLVGALTGALRVFLGVLQVVGTVVDGTVKVLKFLADNWEFVVGAVVGLTVAFGPLIAAQLIYAAVAVATAVIAAAAWLVAAGPIILLVAAIALVVGAVIRFRKQIGGFFRDLGRDIWSVIKGIGSGVAAAFGAVMDAVKAVVNPVVKWFERRINDLKAIVDRLVAAYNWAKEKITGGDFSGAFADFETKNGIAPGTFHHLMSGAPIPVAAAAGGGGAPTVNISAPITVNAKTDASADDIGKAAAKHLDGQVRAGMAALGKGR
jgi:hypothetical protein